MVGTACDTSVLGAPAGELVFRVCGPGRQGQLVRLRSPKCTIGSGPQCTLRLRARGVRAVHCLILRGRATTLVRRWAPDTRLNGRAFQDQPLEPGDLLSIGPVELEVVSLGPPTGEQPQERAEPSGVPRADLPEAELRRRESEGREQEQSLAARAERIESEQAPLAGEAERIRSDREALAAQTQRLEAERAALADQAEWIESERAALAVEAKRLEEKATQLDAQRQSLDTERAAWEAQRTQTEAQSAQQTDADEQREAELEHIRAELERRRREWESEQDARWHELDELARQLGERRQQLDQREKELDQRHQSVEQRAEQLHARRQQLDQRENDLQEQQRLIEQRASQFDGRQQQLDSRQQQLDLHQQQLDARKHELDAREQQLDQLAEQLECRRRDLDSKEAALDCQDAAPARPPGSAQPQDDLTLRPAEPAGDRAAPGDHEPGRPAQATPAREEQPTGGQTMAEQLVAEQELGEQELGEQELVFEKPSERAPVELSAVLQRMGAAPLVPDDEPDDESDSSSAGGPAAPVSSTTDSVPHTPSRPQPDEGPSEDEPPRTEPAGAGEERGEPAGGRTAPTAVAEQPAREAVEEGEDDPEEADEADSESIDVYMAGLLQRSRGWNERRSGPQDGVGARSDEPSGEPDTASRRGRKQRQRDWKRPTAPEKEKDLAAMRQLASQAAQAAIGSHVRRQLVRARWTKLLVAATGLVVGGVLLGMWKAGSANTVAYYGGLVGLLVAVVWGIQHAVLSGRLIVNRCGSLDLNKPLGGAEEPADRDRRWSSSADAAAEAPEAQAMAGTPEAAAAGTVPDPQAATLSNARPKADT